MVANQRGVFCDCLVGVIPLPHGYSAVKLRSVSIQSLEVLPSIGRGAGRRAPRSIWPPWSQWVGRSGVDDAICKSRAVGRKFKIAAAR